ETKADVGVVPSSEQTSGKTTTTTSTTTTSTPSTTSTTAKKASVPKFSQAEKEKFKTLKHLYTFGSIATGVIAALLAEFPPAAIGVGCIAASEATSAEIYDIY